MRQERKVSSLAHVAVVLWLAVIIIRRRNPISVSGYSTNKMRYADGVMGMHAFLLGKNGP